ncbi:hypothetical protein SSX86_024306 [Deinandra increscens subsp. villosa]|uniref:MORF/ORRM1/DAG-like MORF domain-containing protein n=1 Tax=Deinandra increscens subsp. villosa TaxID=3103831 RepID=A0AAP0GPI4_9ASTR
MATRILLRTLLSPVNQTLIPRSFTNSSHILRSRPILAIAAANLRQSPLSATHVRDFSTRQTTSSLKDSNPNWSNRPPKETILLDGCDFEHWLVVMEKPEGDPTRDEIIESYIKTLAKILDSYEEAKMKIYSVSTRCYYAFGALVSEELSYKLKELPGVRWVLPDSYLDVRNKDYGGEPFIDGKAVPYDPKYHEEWIKNNAMAKKRTIKHERPRNFDRPRNIRRVENTQSNHGPNMSGPPANNIRGPPLNNMTGPPPNNMNGPPPPNNMRGPAPNNMSGPNWNGPPRPPYNGGPSNNWNGPPQPPHNGGQPNNWNGPPQPPHNGGQPNNWNGPPQPPYNGGPPNMRGPMPPNNMGGMRPENMGGGVANTAPNYPNYQQQQGRYGPNNGGGGNAYQTQDLPGRDMPSNY